MTNYREILRLCSQGISQRGIASSCQCSRNTVSAVIKRADEIGISWSFEKEMSNGELQTHRTDELDAKFDGLLHASATRDSIASLNSKFDLLNDRLFQTENKINLLSIAK